MSTEALLAKLAARKAQSNQLKTLKVPSNGRGRYRILPSWRGEGQEFWMDFGQHFVKDAAGAVKAVYVCVDKTFGKPCDVCEAIGQGIVHSHDDATKKRLEEAKSSSRVLLNVLHIDGPTPGMVQILEIPPTVFNGNKGVGGIINLFEQRPNLLDFATGYDVFISKSGAGKDTRYAVEAAVHPTAIDPNVMSQVNNLDNYVQQENADSARRALTSVAAITGMLPAPAAAPTMASLGFGGGVADAVPATAYLPPAAPAPVAYPAVPVYAAPPAPVYAPPPAAPVYAAPPAPAAAPWEAPAAPAAPVYAAPPAPAYVPPAAAPAAPAPVAYPAAPAAVAPAPVAVASTGDAELDKLLADLGPAA